MTVDIELQSRIQYMLWIFSGYSTQGMHDAITLKTYTIITKLLSFIYLF